MPTAAAIPFTTKRELDRRGTMKHFAAHLSALLRDKSQRDIARLSGIGQSTLSLYASGARGISVDALGELLKAFPRRPDQLSLVRAHLLDEIPTEVFGELDIEARSFLVEERGETSDTDKELSAALEIIKNKANDPEVRRLIIDLGRILQ